MPRPAVVLSAAALVALLLTGCTDPETPGGSGQSATPTPVADPTAEPTASASPSAEPEPVIVRPRPPAEMEGDGYKAAAAAAKYFLELDDYIMKTNDTAEYQAMSHESCSFCAARLDQARNIDENGDHFDGGETSARVLHVYEQDAPTGIWPIDIETTVAAATITSDSDEVLYSDDRIVDEQRVEVVHTDGRWIIVNVADIDAPVKGEE